MRWQTTAVLGALLAALAGFYYVYEVRLGPERQQAESAKGRVFTGEPADATELAIRRPDQTVRLTKEGDAWQMVEPLKVRGSGSTVQETLTSVLTARIDREIASAPEAVAEYGLDKPAAVIAVAMKDGTRRELELGSRNPTGVWVYAREAGKPAVFLVGESVLRDATRPVADFRDRTVLSFDRGAVSGVEIVTRDAAITVEPGEGRWRITRPVKLPADRQLIDGFLDKLRNAQVKEFAAEAPPALERYGLERPLRLTVHTGQDKDRASRTLLVGRHEPGKGVYAMRPGESSVLLLPEDLWNDLPRNVAVLRNKALVEFDRAAAQRIEIESPKGTVTVAREKDRWTIVAPEALPADQTQVSALVGRVLELRAQGFLTDDASGIARYLAKPQVKVTVTTEGDATHTVLLTPSPERRGGAPSAYAGVPTTGPVALVAASSLQGLAPSVTDLRDRTVLPGLEPRDVKRVRVTSGGQTVVLERRSDTDWRMLEPTRESANAARVDDLLYTLRGLRWTAIAAAGGEEPGRYGLDAPTLEVTLLRDDGGELGKLAVGKRDGAQAYVRTGAGPAIYAVDPARLGETPKLPDAFKPS